jgi:hypothetical protein
MTSRFLSRSVVIATSAGLVTASLMGAASAKGKPAHLSHTHLTVKSAKVHATPHGNYKATLTGTLRSHHTGVAGEVISVRERHNSSKSWTDTGVTATTDSDGKVVVALVQGTVREQYQLVFAGDSTYKKSHSGTTTVNAAKS